MRGIEPKRGGTIKELKDVHPVMSTYTMKEIHVLVVELSLDQKESPNFVNSSYQMKIWQFY